jgi:ABC-type transporter Mla subunit MlaD
VDLLQRLEDRSRHLKTFLAAAEQAASEAATIVKQIGPDNPGELEAQYARLADAEETLHKVLLELGQLMAELERIVAPV